MPRLSIRTSSDRAADAERLFPDETGRLWSATQAGAAVIFTCITDGRQAGRAIATDAALLEDDLGDETLRAWLRAAPRIGRLT